VHTPELTSGGGVLPGVWPIFLLKSDFIWIDLFVHYEF